VLLIRNRAILLAGLVWLAWLFWSPASVASQEPPDLTVTGSGGLAVPGGQVTYHIRLLNWTDEIIPTGTISHTLPAGFNYVPGSAQVSVGGWPIAQADPISQGGSLAWGPFQLPAAGHTAHNPYGAHTFVQDLCLTDFIDFHLDQALELVGSGGYVTQLFYRITPVTTGPDPCAVHFVNAAYDRNLVPILRLQGVWNPVGFWEKPDPGPDGDYAEIAYAFARYVAGLPRRNTHPLYVTIWNEPDLWVEWSGTPSAVEYGRFFVAVSRAIRGLGDPRVRILNGAVTPANTAFIRQLMAVPGFVTAFDAWASHCYPYNHPPWYNIHHRTARYGNTVIDCYIEERDAIARYGGRTGLKFVVKETGHGLGDNLYAFEGFPPINESNRASYISSAFDSYWRVWPEVIAVTPFELGDPWSGWDWLDWIDYTVSMDPFHFSYDPHAQYEAVAALDKPRGDPVPHGFEVTFRAQLADDMPHGTYFSQLYGSAVTTTVSLTQAAPVRVVARVDRYYLPIIAAGNNTGVWYMGVSSDQSPSKGFQPARPDTSTAETYDGDGAIVPTHFLLESDDASKSEGGQLFAIASPNLFALDARRDRAYVGLSNGGLMVLDPNSLEVEHRIPLESELVDLVPGPRAGSVYASLSAGEVILIDAVRGEVVARAGDLDRPRGLAFDPESGNLLVADAGRGEVFRFSQDLAARSSTRLSGGLPDQVQLDPAGRRLYVMLPGEQKVLALDVDTLRPIAEADLAGGPIIDMALDTNRARLYVLSALSPRYRGISVLQAHDLSLVALVAGSQANPLKKATALTLLPDGQLLVAEGLRLYWISPQSFGVVRQARLAPATPACGTGCPGPRKVLKYVPRSGGLSPSRTVWINSEGILVGGSLLDP
jgi:DNA-binding beta-propeller fold protein YncE